MQECHSNQNLNQFYSQSFTNKKRVQKESRQSMIMNFTNDTKRNDFPLNWLIAKV